jgi:succinate-semialdehyde dehydrogenase / glutarate-semialdehyde dehydrogenase
MPPGLLQELESRIAVSEGTNAIPILAPFTEEAIGSTPQAGRADVNRAVARARQAQPKWAATPVRERVRILSRFHDLLLDRAEIAMDVIQLEGGKARVAAFEEVFDTVATTRYYMNTGPGLLRRRRRAVSSPIVTRTWEYHHPVGVVGSISPWNFPFTLAISDIIPALLAGNAVILKPDEQTPYSALYGLSLLEEAGLPEGVAQVVTGDGELIGPDLIDAVDFIAFTGSTAVGRQVAERAGRRLIGASMELGGKNAAIVLADADLGVTIPGVVRGVFANGGQLCISAERIYVERAIADRFTSELVDAVRELEMSTDFDYRGVMSSQSSRRHLELVTSHVEEAVVAGATLLSGGKARPDVGPLFYEPTVLTGVDEAMALCRTETFGPVVSIYPVDDVEEAVGLANDSEYGLNFSVWTSSQSQGVEVATRLRAGTVGVNDGYAATWSSYDAPLGGMMASGLSRRHAAQGILKFTEPQTVSAQRWIPAFAPFLGMTYRRFQRFLTVALKVLKRLPFYK